MCYRDQHSVLNPAAALTLCISIVFLALISALAQTPSQRNGPVKHLPPSTIQQDSPTSPPEQTLPPRFRGWRHTPRAAIPHRSNHGGVGPFPAPCTPIHKLQKSSNQTALGSNGFAFRLSLLAGQIPTAVATGDFGINRGQTGRSPFLRSKAHPIAERSPGARRRTL
jgi:hypothetical protein